MSLVGPDGLPLGTQRIWPWLVIFTSHPRPMFFLTHGRNLQKFEAKEAAGELKIVGRVGDMHSYDAGLKKAQEFCERLNNTIPGARADREQYRDRWRDHDPH